MCYMFEMCYTGAIAIVALLLLQGGESQVSLIRTTPLGLPSVCPNATAVFTCSIMGSSILIWTSAEYIGVNQAGFTSNNKEGTAVNVNSDHDVIATLTQNSGDILVSQLHIRASVDSSIRCNPENAMSGVTLNITIYNAVPGRPTDVSAIEIPSTGDSCAILVSWDPPTGTLREDISHYVVHDSVNGVRGEITTSTTSTLVTVQSSQCTANLSISVTAVDRCEREGLSIDIQPNLLPPSSTQNSPTTIPSNAANTSPTNITLIVVVLVIAVTSILIVTPLVICIIRSRIKIRHLTRIEQREPLLLEESKDDQPKYDNYVFLNKRRMKEPLKQPRVQEQHVKTFTAEVEILLHTVEEEETVAVYDCLKPPLNLEHTLLYQCCKEIEVTLGIFGNHKAALIRTSKGGDCQNEINHALESLPQVQLIIAVGFAYGRRDKCKLGDVLVSTTVDGASSIKINKSSKVKIGEGGIRLTELSKKATTTFTGGKWIDFVCTKGARTSKIHCGGVVSSPMLLNDRSTIEELLARQERFIGGEMAGYDLAEVIRLNNREHHNIDFIVIKGVADFGDGTKEKDWRFTASLAAATFAKARLEESQNYLHHATAAETKLEETETVASGHILAKFELQVLSCVLDAYSNDIIKEIQQSLREKQGGDISLEDVERLLREGGLKTVADDLEQDLLKGVEKAEHYKAYEAALEEAKTVTLGYLRFLLIGVPRSGKSTMRRRMLQEIVNLRSLGQPSVSTGVAEAHDILVQKLTSKSATISDSKWASLRKRSGDASQADSNDEDNVQYLTRLFYSLISKPTADAATDISSFEENNTTTEAAANTTDTGRQRETTDTTIESVADEFGDSDQEDVNNAVKKLTNIHSPEDLHRHQGTSTDTMDKFVADKDSDQKDVDTVFKKMTYTHSPEDLHRQHVTTGSTGKSVADESGGSDQMEVNAAFEKLTEILQCSSPEDYHDLLKALTLINLMDIGGQPEFLDMLPAVTSGAALYLLFFRLDQNLHKHYPVKFRSPDNTREETLDTSYCTEEVINQTLSSIACFSGQLSKDEAKCASSRAILVGTHKDKVKAKDIAHTEKEVCEKFMNTEGYKDLLLQTKEGKPLFIVDNLNGTDESEMSMIRHNIDNIVKAFFPEVTIPVSWLMFRVVLQLLDKPIVTLAQCKKIAHRLLMPTPVQEALWFFHHNIGNLLYYPGIPSVNDRVMCTPQVIFDSVTTVITGKFKHGNDLSNTNEKFPPMGVFSLSDISKKTKEHRSTDLTPIQLVDVLKHNGILAEVSYDDEEATSSEPVNPKFIIPAVLEQASEKELRPSTSLEASPLMIRFEGGFVPFGVFSASIARLIARANSFSSKWRLHGNIVKKNKVKFLVAGAFIATLISRPQYLEIQIEKEKYPQETCGHTPAQICSTVRQTVIETLESVISKMKYQPLDSIAPAVQRRFDIHVAFTCCLHGRKSQSDHLMKVCEGRYGECLSHHTTLSGDLKSKHLLWFNKDKRAEPSSPEHAQVFGGEEYAMVERGAKSSGAVYSGP